MFSSSFKGRVLQIVGGFGNLVVLASLCVAPVGDAKGEP